MSLLDFGVELEEIKEPEKVIKDPEKPEEVVYKVKGALGTYCLKKSGVYKSNQYGEDIELICPTYIKVTEVSKSNEKVEVILSYNYNNPAEVKKDLSFYLDIKKVRTLSDEFKTIYGKAKYVEDFILWSIWKQLDEKEGRSGNPSKSHYKIVTLLYCFSKSCHVY
jgi:hypothetical protein